MITSVLWKLTSEFVFIGYVCVTEFTYAEYTISVMLGLGLGLEALALTTS